MYTGIRKVAIATLACSTTLGAAAPPPVVSNPLDQIVKRFDVAGFIAAMNGDTPSLQAASTVFERVLKPYYAAGSDSERRRILARIAFHCDEDREDPTSTGGALAFPVELLPLQPGAAVWHRYRCRFTIHQNGRADFISPDYTLNQIDLDYRALEVAPAVAFQNYNLGSAAAPDYSWLGRYLQPLNLMLRDRDDAPPANAVAGINGGYDYRVDAWERLLPHDNICLARYSVQFDTRGFYSHPNPVQCPMDANSLPACLVDGRLPYDDDLGDALVYLPAALRMRSWRQTPIQSPNCGGVDEHYARGALLLYRHEAEARRVPPSLTDVQALARRGEPARAAIGAGPLLINDRHFVYDGADSEEGMPIDNYELGGASGAGFEHAGDGRSVLHLVNVDGRDNAAGLHDWMLGLYFLSPYAHADSALALGNGGDATLWISPALPAVRAVLADATHPNHAYFERLFAASDRPGIVSNCAGFDQDSIHCSARPLHDGLFVYTRGGRND